MKLVYIILKNSDMVEGRGPMVITNQAFTELSDAINFIEKQKGVMGIGGEVARYQPSYGPSIPNKWVANDWEVREIKVDNFD